MRKLLLAVLLVTVPSGLAVADDVQPTTSPRTAVVRPQVVPEVTQSPAPVVPPVEQDSSVDWPGQLLLAFLSLLLVARAMFPSRPSRPPSSLVPSG
ncbi:MAG: hypothetical protein ABR549_10430 [Mycobacteriales bacterium]